MSFLRNAALLGLLSFLLPSSSTSLSLARRNFLPFTPLSDQPTPPHLLKRNHRARPRRDFGPFFAWYNETTGLPIQVPSSMIIHTLPKEGEEEEDEEPESFEKENELTEEEEEQREEGRRGKVLKPPPLDKTTDDDWSRVRFPDRNKLGEKGHGPSNTPTIGGGKKPKSPDNRGRNIPERTGLLKPNLKKLEDDEDEGRDEEEKEEAPPPPPPRSQRPRRRPPTPPRQSSPKQPPPKQPPPPKQSLPRRLPAPLPKSPPPFRTPSPKGRPDSRLGDNVNKQHRDSSGKRLGEESEEED